jgi:hypothetical protein
MIKPSAVPADRQAITSDAGSHQKGRRAGETWTPRSYQINLTRHHHKVAPTGAPDFLSHNGLPSTIMGPRSTNWYRKESFQAMNLLIWCRSPRLRQRRRVYELGRVWSISYQQGATSIHVRFDWKDAYGRGGYPQRGLSCAGHWQSPPTRLAIWVGMGSRLRHIFPQLRRYSHRPKD